jgi:proteasome lid subunit RPN8/RPN11
MPDTAILPRAMVDDLLLQAHADPQREICGLISARHGTPCSIYPVANVSPLPEQLFEMQPAAQIAAMRTMRERDESLYAIYHSHPHGTAVPSAEDRAQAAYPRALYIIIAPAADSGEDLRGYRLEEGGFRKVELEIE